MKGRRPKSIEEHKAHGTYRKDRHANRLTVAPLTEIPEPPQDFAPVLREHWRETCEKLIGMGILTAMDLDAVKAYCQWWEIARQAHKEMTGQMVVQAQSGASKPSPALAVYCTAAKNLQWYWEQFGFTPRSRQSIQTAPPDEPRDIIMEILNSN